MSSVFDSQRFHLDSQRPRETRQMFRLVAVQDGQRFLSRNCPRPSLFASEELKIGLLAGLPTSNGISQRGCIYAFHIQPEQIEIQLTVPWSISLSHTPSIRHLLPSEKKCPVLSPLCLCVFLSSLATKMRDVCAFRIFYIGFIPSTYFSVGSETQFLGTSPLTVQYGRHKRAGGICRFMNSIRTRFFYHLDPSPPSPLACEGVSLTGTGGERLQ